MQLAFVGTHCVLGMVLTVDTKIIINHKNQEDGEANVSICLSIEKSFK